MTGPELFAKGLGLLEAAEDADSDAEPQDILLMLRFAEVHFAAAQVAATAEAGRLTWKTNGRQSDWHRALHGEEPTS